MRLFNRTLETQTEKNWGKTQAVVSDLEHRSGELACLGASEGLEPLESDDTFTGMSEVDDNVHFGMRFTEGKAKFCSYTSDQVTITSLDGAIGRSSETLAGGEELTIPKAPSALEADDSEFDFESSGKPGTSALSGA